MLGLVLSLLGVGGVTILGVGLALRFGLLKWLPGAIVNLVSMLFDLLTGLLSLSMSRFLTGLQNIFSTKEGVFTLLLSVVVAMLVGREPLVKLVRWTPWRSPAAVVEQTAAPILETPRKLLQRYVKAPQKRNEDGSILRHQLGR